LRLISRAPGAATVSIGGGTLRLVETGSDARSAPATAIRSSGGWYRIAVAGFSTTPTVLSHLQLERQGR
ncbi:MAG: hypothetical protein HUU35_17315, partial [Armatimonadetes bacterium]|nr:hypothetical protein [Armatimonadota bacterium]